MSKEQQSATQPYLRKLTILAKKQPGYLSGKLLTRYDDTEEHLIICSWKSIADWERFNKLEESREFHYLIDQILVKPTIHKLYVDNSE
ncbi:MAG: hypothetical protein HOE30_15565 [Deltaproteobacteria bacterium]|nr:hypothetical protein [Deltaproteobacteria bacterium]MBT4089902.1 hypothetical protein [Deltaproteobacteria bacterium]MBT4268495.1 hypothetical protein [Deltaproteobacteria bacterium]MBT4644426.1 hypothetical protein [Deltaproteobacteria bacterium]MBT7466165.1 hypothetical protein [Bacteroidota bacterium]